MMNAWRLLFTVKCNEQICDFAYNVARDRTRTDRGLAFTYISTHYGSKADALMNELAANADAELLFAMGYHVKPSDPVKAVDLWVDAIERPRSVALNDDLELLIINEGSKRHLGRLEASDSGRVRQLAHALRQDLRKRGS